MEQTFKLIIIFLWIPQAIGQLLLWIYWWQVKEYRFDRFKYYLESTSGRESLRVNLIILKILLLAISLVVPGLFILAVLIFAFIDLKYLVDIKTRSIRRPAFTQRARRIFATGFFIALASVVGIILGDLEDLILILFWGELLVLSSVGVGILWTSIIVKVIKQKEIIKAKERLGQVKPVVIGITGSYGKGTTKEFLYHLLSKKYKVAKTEGSENTEFGIARRAQKLKKGTEYFIVEMGAYKKGEITKLCNIVIPDIGIITGIEEQHLSLFGNLENIKKAKYELIESLPKKGVAVFNLSSNYCLKLLKKTQRERLGLKILGYFFNDPEKNDYNSNYRAQVRNLEKIKSRLVAKDIEGVVFEILVGKKIYKIFAPLKGIHFIENLTGAILLARYLGVSWRSIRDACRTLVTPTKTMEVHKIKKATIIDDTFNSTPKGFEAAVDYMSLYKSKKKAVITSGIIELGSESFKIHKRIGKMLADSVDQVILTNEDFSEAVGEGMSGSDCKFNVVRNVDSLLEIIAGLMNEGYIILFEGRIPKSIYKNIGLTS